MKTILISNWPSDWPTDMVAHELNRVFDSTGIHHSPVRSVMSKYYVDVDADRVDDFINLVKDRSVGVLKRKQTDWSNFDTDVEPDLEKSSRAAAGYLYDKPAYQQYMLDCRRSGVQCALCNDSNGPIHYPSKTENADKIHKSRARKTKMQAGEIITDADKTDIRLWFSVDHIVPLKVWERAFIMENETLLRYRNPNSDPMPSRQEARRFYNDQSNWQPAHRSCNSSKRDSGDLSDADREWLRTHLAPITAPDPAIAPVPPISPVPAIRVRQRREKPQRLSGEERLKRIKRDIELARRIRGQN